MGRDCPNAEDPRKRPQTRRTAITKTFSPVRFEGKNCETAPISSNLQSNFGRFFCTSDCVAEREKFEPSIQVLARITV